MNNHQEVAVPWKHKDYLSFCFVIVCLAWLLVLQCYFRGRSFPSLFSEGAGYTSGVLQALLSFDICAYK